MKQQYVWTHSKTICYENDQGLYVQGKGHMPRSNGRLFPKQNFHILRKIFFCHLAQIPTRTRPCPEVIKLFPCSTQLSTKFILLIDVKMPTIVGILTFISVINTTSERHEISYFFICQNFIFYEQLKFHAQSS